MTATLAPPVTAPATRQHEGFAGTGTLLRLALRRDRIVASIWILLFVIMAASSSSASQDLYTTLESRVRAANAVNDTPATLALYGRVFDPTSLGAVSLIKLGAMGAALVALVAIFTVVRHTRAEEEAGRLELLGAAVVGRYASLTAALLLATGTSLVLALLTGLSLMGTGLPAAGALAFGLSWAGAGIAFAAVGALAAQVTESARTARGLAAAVLAAAYLLRAAGDATGTDTSTWLSWVSPIGWAQQVRPFAGDRWWVLMYLVAFAVLVAAGAYALAARRDHGAGLLAQKPGRATASPSLSSPLALAVRLQRGSVVGWLVGMAIGGLVLGSIASQVGEFLDTDQARDMIMKLGGERGIVDAFLSAEMGILAVVVSAFGISSAMRLRSEETALRVEPILATRIGRFRWAASHVVVALAGTTLLMIAVGVFGGFAHGAASGDMGAMGRVVVAALVQLPSVWVLTGITVLVFGAAPGLVMAGWGALVAFLLLGQLGPIFELPQWAMDISPFTHTPKLPGAEFTATPLVWLTVVAAALVAAGLAAFRRRDVG
ncbi:ABC transporter permease [Actinophytocola algeriensis]|uniref:ABC-2 type transport system permease protein n=1 Tax=Actinophytocola algeriensis TaxID=1768010 RepID=A0A7W7Q5H8_9PSEU|nr:ABC transporter permease [Actinophytocola algeriensis]MBB4907054.1 ABC-2 type transport system permease protein [Actinophytocola algeriensis]MBE1478537.1 ABC-2 type transport system permease protein [Actinophytocola algeriensis]